MIVHNRQWWINIWRWTVFRGRYYGIRLLLDYDGIDLNISLGYFGFWVKYLAPGWEGFSMQSGYGIFWDQTQPLVEGGMLFRKVREHVYMNGSIYQYEIERGKRWLL